MRGATLFSGGGGCEALLKKRIDFVHAVEYDPKIADVYRVNHGDHIQVAKVEDVDYSLWGMLDYLHASPVCTRATHANSRNAGEDDRDIQSALAVARCLEATQPRVFTLENVWGYRNFKAFKLICQALGRGVYMWHFEHLNAADFGVPQTRWRLILRAVRDSLLPGWPAPLPWVGWYAAIEDLLPLLPDSQFADWQIPHLPKQINGNVMPSCGLVPKECEVLALRYADCPSFGITSRATYGRMKVFILDNVSNHDPMDRDWIQKGRMLKLTPRALARLQSIPDAFILPNDNGISSEIVGNAVPSLLMWNVVTPLL